MDEPEAALSIRGCLAVLARIADLAEQNCQFVIATHSPILLALPGATILQVDDEGAITHVDDDEAMPALDQRGFCSEWILLDSSHEDGSAEFECECGRFNASYPDADAGIAALDAHLDEQEVAAARFFETWIAEHRTDGTSGP